MIPILLMITIIIVTPIIISRVSQLGVRTNGFRAAHKSGKNEQGSMAYTPTLYLSTLLTMDVYSSILQLSHREHEINVKS